MKPQNDVKDHSNNKNALKYFFPWTHHNENSKTTNFLASNASVPCTIPIKIIGYEP